MREYKFRAWDKAHKEMLYSVTVMPCGTVYFDSTIHFKKNKKHCKRMFTGWLTDEDLPVMQYTGLKDKNGKEIYEGDIVSTKCTMVKYIKTPNVHGLGAKTKDTKAISNCLVKWEGYGFVFFHIVKNCHLINIPSFEIIGNIHENPELL